MPSPFLGVSKHYADASVPVTQVELDNSVSPNVEVRAIGLGMVPIYEEHTVRLESGYKLNEWTALDVMEKALLVAVRRSRIALENIQADEQIKHAKRNAKRRR